MTLVRRLSTTCLTLLTALAGVVPAAVAADRTPVSIASFSDLRPTDWAYQAIANLADRYGCLDGYRNGLLDGQRSITRYEAAALLNSCLVQVTEATDEIRRLQSEFAQEMATLSGRLTTLESRESELRATSFSTTTRLRGEASFMLGAVNYGGDVAANGVGVSPFLPRQDALNFVYSLRLGLGTSFTGKDLFYTQLRTGNAGNSPFNTFNPLFPPFTSTVPLAALERGYAPSGGDNILNIERLFYKFPLNSQVTATVAARIMDMGLWGVYPTAYGVRGDNVLDFFSSFGTPGVYNKAVGSGFGLTWREKAGWTSSTWLAHVHYIAVSPSDASSGGIGRAESRGNIAAQIGYQSPQFNVTLGYRYGQSGTDFGRGTDFASANQWSLPYLSGASSNSVAINGYWRPPIGSWLPAISAGWALNVLDNPGVNPLFTGTFTVSQSQSWMLGLQWDNVSGINDVLGMAVGQPTFATALQNGQTPGDGNYAMELFYRYPISDHINITPSVFYLSRPYGQLTVGNFNLFAALVQVNFNF